MSFLYVSPVNNSPSLTLSRSVPLQTQVAALQVCCCIVDKWGIQPVSSYKHVVITPNWVIGARKIVAWESVHIRQLQISGILVMQQAASKMLFSLLQAQWLNCTAVFAVDFDIVLFIFSRPNTIEVLYLQGLSCTGSEWYLTDVETQFSTGWYWPILWLMTTGLHSTTSPSCVERFHILCAASLQ